MKPKGFQSSSVLLTSDDEGALPMMLNKNNCKHSKYIYICIYLSKNLPNKQACFLFFLLHLHSDIKYGTNFVYFSETV